MFCFISVLKPNDDLFNYKYGVESFEKIKEMCKTVGTEWLSFELFNGTHVLKICLPVYVCKRLKY